MTTSQFILRPKHGLCRWLLAGLLLGSAAGPLRAQDLPCGSPHVVVAGDTLSGLARRAYGDADRYPLILDANREALGGDPENLSIGLALDIPCPDGAPVAGGSAAMEAAVAAEGPLSAEELDTLFGPVALFPDRLLTPVLVATTFPLDVVKAGRFLEENADLGDNERADEAATAPWDDSLRELTAGFPDLVTRMSDNIDWTEQAGEAVVVQTDDVLASIQRLRAKAQKNGYLEDSPAQAVETVNQTIRIIPAQPGVVYVPTYDSQVVYTTPVAAGQPVYHHGYDYGYDDGTYWNDLLIGGGILLGGAVILDEIFDDDDWDGWDIDDDIDWDRGDITIDRGDRNIQRGDIVVDRDRVNIDRDRISIGASDRPQVGRDELRSAAAARAAARPGQRPVADPASRAIAREKIEARKTSGARPANLDATRSKAAQAAARRQEPARQVRSTQVRASPAARASRQQAVARAKISRPAAQKIPRNRASGRPASAFQRPTGGPRPAAASNRGRSSMASRGGRGGGGRRR